MTGRPLMTALRIMSEFAAALLGVAIGRVLGERIGIGAVPWPAGIAGTVALTAWRAWHQRRH